MNGSAKNAMATIASTSAGRGSRSGRPRLVAATFSFGHGMARTIVRALSISTAAELGAWSVRLSGAQRASATLRLSDHPRKALQWTSTSRRTSPTTSPSSTTSSSARSSRSSRRTTTSASSTIAARTPAPTGSAAACRTTSGRRCCARPAVAPTRPATTATRSRRSTAARTARTSGWPSSASTSPRKGLGLHNDLQNEHSIVGNNVGLLLMIDYGTDEQKAEWIDDLAEGRRGFAFGITEPEHGSDATHMETTAVRDGDEWVINGEKTWNTGIHKAQYDLIFARTSGEAGDGDGITAFLVPTEQPGLRDRRVPVDVQHADRPRPHPPHRRPRARTARSSAARAGASRSCSTSSTRTASARPRRASARRSSASTSRSSTPRSARRSASRSRRTRRSSSRSSSCRPSARCCGR